MLSTDSLLIGISVHTQNFLLLRRVRITLYDASDLYVFPCMHHTLVIPTIIPIAVDILRYELRLHYSAEAPVTG